MNIPANKHAAEALAAAQAISDGDTSDKATKRAHFALLKCTSAINGAIGDELDELKKAKAVVMSALEYAKVTDRETAAQLVRRSELFHDVDGTPYGMITVGNHKENVAVRSRRYKQWLTLQFRDAKGKAPSSDALSVAQNEGEAIASLEGPQIPVHTRTAMLDGRMYLDLCDEQWKAVEIDADGWRIVADPPVKFVRHPDARPLPMPVAGGSLDALRPYVNVASNDDWHMLIAWLVGALAPDGPYPILMLYGEQGSAKSSTARALRAVIDPAATQTRRTPKDEHDLLIAARRCRILVFDNLSTLKVEMSDALCRLATGGGLGTRKLYTDDEEATFYAKRPVIINGIDEVATRGDLLDRALVLQLPKLDPGSIRDEATLNWEFNDAHPRILGALLDAVSAALRNLDATQLDYAPRMADFARWVEASEAVRDFLAVYGANRIEAVAAEIEASPFASAVLDLAREDAEWTGTAAQLLGVLNLTREPNERGRNWPDTANKVGNWLRRYSPALRTQGVTVQATRSNGIRRITLSSADPVPTSADLNGHSADLETA